MGPHQKRSFRKIILNESSLWVHLRWSACVLRSYFVRSGGQSTHKHNNKTIANTTLLVCTEHRWVPWATRLWWPVNDMRNNKLCTFFWHELWLTRSKWSRALFSVMRWIIQFTFVAVLVDFWFVRRWRATIRDTEHFLFVRCFYFNDEKDTETALDKHCFKYSLHELAFLFAFCELRQRDTQANWRTDDIQRNDDAMRSMA